jgi:hypothetical protein
MSDAVYEFLSVLRRGLAASIPAATPAGDARVAVTTSLSVGGQAMTALPALALRGPGDIIGFDAAAICRTWPAANAGNAEPNYFALAELTDADLPWRYTPQATSGDRLTPWLCLIVVEDAEIGALVPASRDRPLAAVTVNDAGALPDLAQAWAWAHAQIVGGPDAPATDFSGPAVAALLASNPSRLRARLLCPRKLDPQTRYLACVVPSFKRGRLAGLGLPVDHVDRLEPAWAAGHAPVTLPVYYSWRFQTGQPGDFAALVHLLQARGKLPKEVWQRDLAVSPPGVIPPAWQVVGLEGALRTLDASSTPWSTLDTQDFTAALAARSNATGTQLGPPLYGRWLAATARLSTADGATPPWFHQLNGDPRARTAAGLGTLVVQTEQQELLAAAWAQVDGIRRINTRLRLSQLARELATRLHARHFAVAGDAFLHLTAPVHGHVRSGATTVQAQLASSAIATGAMAPAFRRAARPLGSLGARQGRPSLPPPSAAQGVLARMNSGALAVVPAPAAAPPGITGVATQLGDLGAVFKRVSVTPESFHKLPQPPTFVLGSVVHPLITTAVATTVEEATEPATGTGAAVGTGTAVGTGAAAAAASFAHAASALMAQLARPHAAGVQWQIADLDGLHGSLATSLHPKRTIEAPLAARLSGVVGGPTRIDPIEPVMAAPEFPQPMYEPLKELSQDWLIPGLDQVPANSVALLATNWPFVESFLVGLNHEMARKLLWNGYPTDQRGTYFRHFWDLRSRTDGTTDGDVGPIHHWTRPLGSNRLRSADPLILLVRGELIRRYPNVVVYAAQADALRQPGSTEKQPIFFGRLDPDVALFGFDLDAATARGNPGWFFVLQEHPSEPRFGLAAPRGAWGAKPTSWQALGWDHLAATPDALAALRHVDLGATLPQDPAAADPTGAVWHASSGSRAADLAHITFRRPSRLAIHASTLVPDGATR